MRTVKGSSRFSTYSESSPLSSLLRRVLSTLLVLLSQPDEEGINKFNSAFASCLMLLIFTGATLIYILPHLIGMDIFANILPKVLIWRGSVCYWWKHRFPGIFSLASFTLVSSCTSGANLCALSPGIMYVLSFFWDVCAIRFQNTSVTTNDVGSFDITRMLLSNGG